MRPKKLFGYTLQSQSPNKIAAFPAPDRPHGGTSPSASINQVAPATVPIPYYTEYFVVNRTSKTIQVGLSQSARSVQKASDVHEVTKRDTLRGGEFIDEDAFGEWAQRIHFQLQARKPKWLQGVSIDMEHPIVIPVDATHRRCYFFIEKAKKP